MWKCPECGSFMVFGEDGETHRFTFYERQEAEKVEPLFDPDQELNLVVVEFQEGLLTHKAVTNFKYLSSLSRLLIFTFCR